MKILYNRKSDKLKAEKEIESLNLFLKNIENKVNVLNDEYVDLFLLLDEIKNGFNPLANLLEQKGQKTTVDLTKDQQFTSFSNSLDKTIEFLNEKIKNPFIFRLSLDKDEAKNTLNKYYLSFMDNDVDYVLLHSPRLRFKSKKSCFHCKILENKIKNWLVNFFKFYHVQDLSYLSFSEFDFSKSIKQKNGNYYFAEEYVNNVLNSGLSSDSNLYPKDNMCLQLTLKNGYGLGLSSTDQSPLYTIKNNHDFFYKEDAFVEFSHILDDFLKRLFFTNNVGEDKLSVPMNDDNKIFHFKNSLNNFTQTLMKDELSSNVEILNLNNKCINVLSLLSHFLEVKKIDFVNDKKEQKITKEEFFKTLS